MKFIKYADYKGQELAEDECVLMSKKEFDEGGKGWRHLSYTRLTDNGAGGV